MEDSLIFKGVEEQTLKRDELLSKLRSQIEKLEKRRATFSEVMNTVHKLVRSRKVYMKYLSPSKSLDLGKEGEELLRTLLEFTLWVSIDDEIELLKKLQTLAKARDDVSSGDVKLIQEEIRELQVFRNAAEEFLSRTV